VGLALVIDKPLSDMWVTLNKSVDHRSHVGPSGKLKLNRRGVQLGAKREVDVHFNPHTASISTSGEAFIPGGDKPRRYG